MSSLRIVLVGLLLAVTGCVSVPTYTAPKPRAFDFKRDTLAYANEMVWEYRTDPVTGQITTHVKTQKPEFTQRCFTVSRMARQFFQYAQFDPALPKADGDRYREIIDAVVSRSPGEAREQGKVVIPGYANLRRFSRDHAALLKAFSGGPLSSYFQFSNWRMIFPFSRDHQARTAQQFLDAVKLNRLPLAHLIRFDTFPVTEIDHFIMIVSAVETATEIRFRVFEPNEPARPSALIFDRATRSFIFPRNRYFAGGAIDVYEVNRDEYF